MPRQTKWRLSRDLEKIHEYSLKCRERCGLCCAVGSQKTMIADLKNFEPKQQDASERCVHLTWKNSKGKTVYSCSVRNDPETRGFLCELPPLYLWHPTISPCKTIEKLFERLPPMTKQEKVDLIKKLKNLTK